MTYTVFLLRHKSHWADLSCPLAMLSETVAIFGILLDKCRSHLDGSDTDR